MGFRDVHLSLSVLKLEGDIKLGQGLELQLLCLAMCAEKVGLQRERRMKLTQERNKRRQNGREEREMVATITKNSLFLDALKVSFHSLPLGF